MTFNGSTLPINIVSVKGRGPISQESVTKEVPYLFGSVFVKRNVKSKPLVIEFDIKSTDTSDMRTKIDSLIDILNVDSEKQITFSDETWTYNGILSGTEDWDETYLKGKGTLTFLRSDPFKYATTPVVDQLTTKPTTTTNFVGKISGSTVENANISKWCNSSAATSLQAPTSNLFSEVGTGGPTYSQLTSVDNNKVSVGSSVNGVIAQNLFSFNLIAAVEKVFGIIPATDKVAWVKANITKTTFNWHGYGSGPGGNNAKIAQWAANTSSWDTSLASTTNGTVTMLQDITTGAMSNRVDSNGFMHYLAYSPTASDGTTSSVINTDYVEIVVETNLGLIVLSEYDSLPIIDVTFTGSATEYKITHQETGKYVRIVFNFVSGNTLKIDLTKRKILINGSLNMASYDVNSTPFKLQKGNNTFVIDQRSVSTNTISYTRRKLQ
jgi:predicted phage tail component-like protein